MIDLITVPTADLKIIIRTNVTTVVSTTVPTAIPSCLTSVSTVIIRIVPSTDYMTFPHNCSNN